jgi:hypothetical protein
LGKKAPNLSPTKRRAFVLNFGEGEGGGVEGGVNAFGGDSGEVGQVNFFQLQTLL